MTIEQDDLLIQEMKNQKFDGLTQRGKIAIKELADQDFGALIFLILSLNSRINKLEKKLFQ